MTAHLEPHTFATEAAPCVGEVMVDDIKLSEAERWYADGVHVVRSTEFDCIAEDPDGEKVIDTFVDTALDTFLLLSELQERGEATEAEIDTLTLVAPRLARWAVKIERQEQDRRRHRRIRSRLRKRGDSRHWGPSTPSSSSLVSPG